MIQSVRWWLKFAIVGAWGGEGSLFFHCVSVCMLCFFSPIIVCACACAGVGVRLGDVCVFMGVLCENWNKTLST